ncbi:MAG: peptide chain release factor N(5)-glutamine methyltransferase [Candidatus Marisimplicoccus sp.]|tara:strand:- start:664 stop:1524 length:861 start_codon:yes stop_codon:yes gene_type:complete
MDDKNLSMNVIEMRSVYREKLDLSIDECDFIYKIILKELCDIDPIKIALDPTFNLSSKSKDTLLQSMNMIIDDYPIDYLINKKNFYGKDFYINENVLIPRPETEELVDWLINDNIDLKDQKNVIDLCSGSGCIGISLDINNKYLNVTLSDVSTIALKVCKINKKNLNSNVKIIQLDLNSISTSDKEYDIIISNPPYISLDESNQIGKNVKYEPDIALFTPKDKPLHFYEKILEFALTNLSKNGVIYLEINPNFISEFNELLTNYTINHINFKDDFRGKKRLVKLTF